jgi:predicted enzyme related to lactoylglutathione lyase
MMHTADIEQTFAYVQESGIAITLEIQRPHHGLAYFNIADCEGNILTIVQSDWVNPQPQPLINPDHPIKNHISSVVIPVIDLKRATEWYSKLIGQPIKPDRQDGGPIYWFEMANGTGILLDDNRNNQDFGKYPTFMLKSSNIHEAYAVSQESGVKIVRDVQFDHYFMIEDPEGNVVMICL